MNARTRWIALSVLASAWPTTALANGNVSHQWVSHEAAALTPEGGTLADVARDPTLVQALDTGTMFPDWGYTPGATAEERNAGEASHWEPVQEGYRRWIVDTFAPPWSNEARLHLAFYLGMTSHGMADQTYDAMFFERSEFFQGGDHGAFDQDTDVMWSAHTGPGEAPTAWIPAEPLLELFVTEAGARLSEPDVMSQLSFVGLAITAVSAIAMDPDQVVAAEERYAWAAEHDDDPATPGNPPHEAEIVRRYWRSNWALLHGDALPRPVLWTHPADGGAGHPTDAASIDSWITLVFSRALSGPHVDPEAIHLTGPDGADVPIELDLFYGDGSHVLHVQPQDDLSPDAIYVVTVDPGWTTIHDESLEGWTFTFSTGVDGPTPRNDDGFWDEPDPYDDWPTGGSSTGGSSSSGGESPSTESSGGLAPSTTTTTGEPPVGSSSGAPADASTDDAGCGCTQTPGAMPMVLLLAGFARRRRSAAVG